MATKVVGLAWSTLSVGDSSNTTQDIRNAITELDFATPRAVQDVTGIDKSALERLLLLADYSINLKGVFDTLAVSGAHVVFSTVPSTSVNRVVSVTTNGKNLNMGATGAGNGAVLFTDYKITRSASGELLWEAPGVGSTGTVPTWSLYLVDPIFGGLMDLRPDLWHCAGCSTSYAVGLPACPQCGSTVLVGQQPETPPPSLVQLAHDDNEPEEM